MKGLMRASAVIRKFSKQLSYKHIGYLLIIFPNNLVGKGSLFQMWHLLLGVIQGALSGC